MCEALGESHSTGKGPEPMDFIKSYVLELKIPFFVAFQVQTSRDKACGFWDKRA